MNTSDLYAKVVFDNEKWEMKMRDIFMIVDALAKELGDLELKDYVKTEITPNKE